MFVIEFWQRVYVALETTGLRMADIARLTEIPRSTISNWIRWNRYPAVDDAERIANILGVSVEWLVKGVDVYEDYDDDLDPPQVIHLINTIRAMDENQLNALEPVLSYMAAPVAGQEPSRKKKK
ncbi:MAG: helix-turn-helix transcriptional regulator [Sphaerochaetaceae bacterium]|nr:helix-turn-helix transcriptional regulator [Sphaerochaetaceae bacterium]